MSTADWIVIVLGLAAIGWVNWYFFVAGQQTNRRETGTDNEQRDAHHRQDV